MAENKNSFLNSEEFTLNLTEEERVELSFGPAQLTMNLDEVYELQYKIAAFLAKLELEYYPTLIDAKKDPALVESRNTLVRLSKGHVQDDSISSTEKDFK